ncbi:hypothetical protein D1867_10535 [Acidianus infernus]|uniref:Uncharacterized protein n=2 Tax=Acidianus infernus TaxID=12915 RepID=A0A6A9QP31_ACIIN|nr:hypothetical protein [Acidianus infernus]MUM65668.1 hypothetical protein [Acidianus infernus]
MKSINLSLVVDENFNPLPTYKQLAISIAKVAGKNNKISLASLVGWPLLAVKSEAGGYYIFDETGKFSTSINSLILQDYNKIISMIEKTSDESQVLELMNSIRWDEVRGSSTIHFDFVMDQEFKNLLKLGSSQLPLQILDRKLKDIDVQFLISDIQGAVNKIISEIDLIEKIKEKISEIIAIIKGKRVEKRRQIESEYDAKIMAKNEELKKVVNSEKTKVEEEIKQYSSQLYSKLPDIEVLIAKAELDKEAGFIDSTSSVNSIKEKYLNEISEKLNEIKEKHKIEIRRLRSELNELNSMKQKDLNKINEEIKKLDELQQSIISKLNNVENSEKVILDKLQKLPKFISILVEDRAEIVVPLLIAQIDSRKVILPPQIYKGGKKGFFGGIFRKDPSEISEDVEGGEIFVNSFDLTVQDNLRNYKDLIEKGLQELYEEGWSVRRSLDEYYIR